jgi:hypothetical protein
MKIPIFVSCPTILNKDQMKAREIIVSIVEEFGLEPRALGRTDYPADYPLKEVFVLAKHCSGGIILGFEQFSTSNGVWRKRTKEEKIQREHISFPTPWNQLEAGVLFGLGLPLMVFKESTLVGGVFDPGVTDVFIHKILIGRISKNNRNALREVILNWQRKVRMHYYEDRR